MRHTLVLLILTAAVLSDWFSVVSAEETATYQVDLIVFRHSDPFTAGETFDLTETSPLVPTFTDLSLDDEREDASSEPQPAPIRRIEDYEALETDALALTETARRLANAQRFDVLDHLGWQQPALPMDEAAAQRISVGGVRGTVQLSRSRFLRLDVDLNFNVDGVPVALKQTRRRVQTGKPHYIDHPHIGAIIQVSRTP